MAWAFSRRKMMSTDEPDWMKYATKAREWIQEALARVQEAEKQMSPDQKHVGLAASYCFLAAHDYLKIAFYAFHKKRYHPGMACLRPVVEMGITFIWCTMSVSDYLDRLRRWIKESFNKRDKTFKRLEDWVFSESDKEAFGTRKADWKEQQRFFKDLKDLPPVLNMLEEIDKRKGGTPLFRILYPTLYSSLCDSSHARMVLDRYFTFSGTAYVPRRHSPMPPDAPRASLTAVAFLIAGVYTFFGWECSKLLNEYQEIVEPSLGK
jgi:hypothetical protein